MLAHSSAIVVTWEKLPANFVLPDDPVDNINQPPLAVALTESLELAGRLPETVLASTNYGICATINGQLAIKAPDWAYVPHITVPRSEIAMSYTPHLQGEPLALVIEFVSATDGGEYSTRSIEPLGKWFFYEQVLQVPYYAIFEPQSGDLEVYSLDADQRYRPLLMDNYQHYWIPSMQLALAAWQGIRENRTGYWLRWWDGAGNLLPWRSEIIADVRHQVAETRQRAEAESQRAEAEHQRAEAESQRAEAEHQRAEAESQRAERLAEILRSLGHDPNRLG
jgi:Putative restriction endonuclease